MQLSSPARAWSGGSVASDAAHVQVMLGVAALFGRHSGPVKLLLTTLSSDLARPVRGPFGGDLRGAKNTIAAGPPVRSRPKFTELKRSIF